MLSNLPMFTKTLYNRFKKRILEGLLEYNHEIYLSDFEELGMFLDMPVGKYMGICLDKMQKEGYLAWSFTYLPVYSGNAIVYLECKPELWIGLNPFWNAKSNEKDDICLKEMYNRSLRILGC